MKDINSVRLSGEVFWSKLNDRQTFKMLQLGIKLSSGDSVFCVVNNPDDTNQDLKGTKALLTTAWFDTWEREDGDVIQIKCYASGIQFFPREARLQEMNDVTIIGNVISYNPESGECQIEMVGERSPKTNQWSKRKTTVVIDSGRSDIVGSKILLQAEVKSEEIAEGKSKMIIVAKEDRVTIL